MVYFNLESGYKDTQNFSQMKIQRQKYYSDAATKIHKISVR